MPYNVTIDDISPLITWKGQWTDAYNTAADPNTGRYLGRTFHSSLTDGSQASITFNGTAIYIFGAKRGNHGHYIVTVDNDQSQRFDGYAPEANGVDGVYQVPLFAKTDLKDGLHTVVLTNDPGTDTSKPYVDIDFITWTSNDPTPSKNITIDDYHWNYTIASQWGTDSKYVVDYLNNTEHLTNTGGATTSVEFQGSAVYLYGGTLDDHGMFSVQVNDHSPVSLNGSSVGYHPRVLLYYADGLGSGTHKLTVINTEGGKYLDVDYIDVVQSSSSEASQDNPGGKAKTPIIAGTICGVVIGAAWLIALVWWLMRRRKRNSEPADLLGAEAKPYDAPPAGYGASGGPGWNTQQQQNQPWANDPAYTASFTQTQTQSAYPMSMYPPSSVSGSGGGSSSGAPSSYGGPTRPSVNHQPLSTLTQADEPDTVTEMVPPPNPKARPPQVQATGTRGEMTEEELRVSRMQVPERPQDWGPVSDTSDTEYTGMLPPDYNQATEPFPARRS